MQHDQIKILQITTVTHASIAHREEHQTQMDEVLGSMLNAHFVAGFFVFAH